MACKSSAGELGDGEVPSEVLCPPCSGAELFEPLSGDVLSNSDEPSGGEASRVRVWCGEES